MDIMSQHNPTVPRVSGRSWIVKVLLVIVVLLISIGTGYGVFLWKYGALLTDADYRTARFNSTREFIKENLLNEVTLNLTIRTSVVAVYANGGRAPVEGFLTMGDFEKLQPTDEREAVYTRRIDLVGIGEENQGKPYTYYHKSLYANMIRFVQVADGRESAIRAEDIQVGDTITIRYVFDFLKPTREESIREITFIKQNNEKK